MDLKEYLYQQRSSLAQFAKKIKYSRAHLSGICSGKFKASRRLADVISENTDHQVKYEDLNKE